MKRALVLVMALAGCQGAAGTSSGSSTGASTNQTPTTTTTTTTTPTPPTTAPSTSTTTSSSGLPPIFPSDNPWNTDISTYPVHANSANFVASVGLTTGLHPDFGSDPNSGIPYCVVDNTQPFVPITAQYASESDPGPYPVPANAPIEGGAQSTGDRHVLVVDTGNSKLYEMWSSTPNPPGWSCGSAAIFDLTSNALRPMYWTSADAAGLPVFPGLVRYDECVTQGAINHALRFTIQNSQHGFVSPARHWAATSTDPNLPPMGLRFRLKASVSIAGLPPEVQVILTCLKKYGMMVADNGSNWFISGAPDPRWNDSNLHMINQITGADFEVVDTGPITTQ